MKVEVRISMQGTAFSPKALAERTNLLLQCCNEPGGLGKTGKYRNLPLPYGSALWVCPFGGDIAYGFALEEAIKMLERHIASVRACRAEEIVMRLDVTYEAQCNLELSTSDITRIASLGIPLAISCEQI